MPKHISPHFRLKGKPMTAKEQKAIRADERKKVVEEVWKMLGDFRKYTPHNIVADAGSVRGRLIEIAGQDCNLEI